MVDWGARFEHRERDGEKVFFQIELLLVFASRTSFAQLRPTLCVFLSLSVVATAASAAPPPPAAANALVLLPVSALQQGLSGSRFDC